MRFFRINLILIAIFLLVGGYILVRVSVVQAQSFYNTRGMTPREMFSRGAIRAQEQRIREKLRQLRIQDARMPRDIRAMAPIPLRQPGEARPEIIDYLGRDRTKFIAGGWLWNSAVKGSSYPIGTVVEQDITDPEGVTIRREEPIVEWWEVSERSREQRAEFFRARFGAAQQMRIMPSEEGELRQPGETGITPPESGRSTPMSQPGGGF